MENLYHINAIPSDTQLRTALDPLEPAPLRELFATLLATKEILLSKLRS